MKTTRVIKWGKAEVEISHTRSVEEKIKYSDGYKIPMGKETVDVIEITVSANGKQQARSSSAPAAISPVTYFKYDELIEKGVYARLGDAYINKTQYNQIVEALAEIESELDNDAEYKKIKAQETAREQAGEREAEAQSREYNQKIKNGFCPRCDSYCYGDCGAN